MNPHCSHCRDEFERDLICNNCEYLKMQIAVLQRERDKLLDQLLIPTAEPESIESMDSPQPLNTSRFIPFAVKRQELEKRDREIAKQRAEELIKKHHENVAELEKEVLEAKVPPIEVGDEA